MHAWIMNSRSSIVISLFYLCNVILVHNRELALMKFHYFLLPSSPPIINKANNKELEDRSSLTPVVVEVAMGKIEGPGADLPPAGSSFLQLGALSSLLYIFLLDFFLGRERRGARG
jgi:hypothetical protein